MSGGGVFYRGLLTWRCFDRDHFYGGLFSAVFWRDTQLLEISLMLIAHAQNVLPASIGDCNW